MRGRAGGDVLAGGCWTQIGYGPGRRRFNPSETGLTIDNVESLAAAWSVNVPGIVTEPMVSGNRVYVTRAESFLTSGVSSAAVRALDAGTGATLWDTSIFPLGGRFAVTPVPVTLVGDQLWSGFGAQTVLAPPACPAGGTRLDAADGTILGTTEGPISPAVVSGTVAAHTVRPSTGSCGAATPLTLLVHDVDSAELLWTATLPGSDAGLVLDVPTIVDGRIYVVVEATLHAFPVGGCGASTCSPEWSVDLGSPIDATSPVGGLDGQIFVLSEAGQLLALDAASGAELWRAPYAAAIGRVAATGDAVYVTARSPETTDQNALQVFAANGCGGPSCGPLWTAALGASASIATAPVVAGGVVYVGNGAAVQAFNAGGCGSPTCTPVVTVPVPTTASSLSVAQGKLFVAGSNTLSAFAPG